MLHKYNVFVKQAKNFQFKFFQSKKQFVEVLYKTFVQHCSSCHDRIGKLPFSHTVTLSRRLLAVAKL